MEKAIIVDKSTIRGYHIFKICPQENVEMAVPEEKDNKWDPHAMIVKMPDEEKYIDEKILDLVTHP